MTKEQFAVVDKDLFRGPTADTNATISKLIALNDYISIASIVNDDVAQDNVIFKKKELSMAINSDHNSGGFNDQSSDTSKATSERLQQSNKLRKVMQHQFLTIQV